MPRIPTARPDDSAIFGPAPTKQASGQAMGAGVNAAQAQLGDALNRAALAIGNTRRSIRVGQAYSEAMAELDEFGDQLVNGYQDDNGNIVEPPEPEKHSEMWDTKVGEIGEKMRKFLGDDASFRAFNNRFGQSALRASVTVRKNALTQQKLHISADVADTLSGLSTLAGQAAIEGDALLHNDIISQADLTFADLVEKRVWSPEKAQTERKKFLEDVDKGHIRGIINKDPVVAVETLRDYENFPNLSEEDRQAWIDTAIDQYNTNRSRQIAEINFSETQRKREFEKRQTELVAQFEQMIHDGDPNFSYSMVIDHKNELDTDTLKYYVSRAQGDETWVTDRAVYADLFLQANAGINVKATAKTAFKLKQLSRSAFDKIVASYDAATGQDAKLPSYYSRVTSMMRLRLGADGLNVKYGQKVRAGKAIEEFMRWSHENPDAPFMQAMDEAVALTEQYRFVGSDTEENLSMPFPRYMPKNGDRSGFDVQKAWEATKEARKREEIDEERFNKEAEILRDWKERFDAEGISEQYAPKPEPAPAPAPSESSTPKGDQGAAHKKRMKELDEQIAESERKIRENKKQIEEIENKRKNLKRPQTTKVR